MTAPTWEHMLAVARRYGYDGPDTPTRHTEQLALASALVPAVRAAGGPEPWEGTGPAAWIGRVMRGEVPLPC